MLAPLLASSIRTQKLREFGLADKRLCLYTGMVLHEREQTDNADRQGSDGLTQERV